MRMMGADSVAYHQATVMGRADDHPGAAVGYYASRGETPLAWGGSGAEAFGLAGAVTDAQYEALYGPGGACDPTTSERLVRTRRPGLELVISAHKSVAELGVIGRAEDMHEIMDAERDASLAYLDELTLRMGGRRGRAALASRTAGLIYAVTRHATSRAGDPCPHDHVLIANVVEMLDPKGGYKAPDTTLWRDHLHAATVAGRVASARKAMELGYGIVADDGPSGRLGHWAVAGIPDEVLEVHSKRSQEISQAVSHRGHDGYRARQVAARETRGAKRDTPVAELLPHWRGELAEVGYTVPELVASIEAAADRHITPGCVSQRELRALVRTALDGTLSTRKVFTRRDVVVAVGPALFGRPPEELKRVVDAVLTDPDALPLLGVAGARERAYATASVIATEAAIANAVAQGASARGAAVLPSHLVTTAVAAREAELGWSLTAGQAEAVWGICTGGERVSLVLGVAGAGKTTALAGVADAYRAAGYTLVGTATSGQAARTLGRAAGIAESRTLASLRWRIEHVRLLLSERHVVILDEVGMTEDADLLALLTAADVGGAKVVLVGDDRQLGSVGPGGALGALLERHGGVVHVLGENVRQRDPAERSALAELRAGDVGAAVSWYVGHRRIAVSRNRDTVLDDMVEAWLGDALGGRDAAMYAWRRASVDQLNRRARQRWGEAGRLSGPELVAPGGRCYAAGDRIVTLAPGAGGEVVTSERGVVEAVDLDARALVARMEDGRLQRLDAEATAVERLAHGYAVTVHRSQGATVDVAHRFEDGGGRELAYVAMSRAKERSTVYVVADSLEQATEDLRREWSSERRPSWAIDSGTPATDALAVEDEARAPEEMREALRRARLRAEREAVAAVIPPDPTSEIVRSNHTLTQLQQRRTDLPVGRGVYGYSEIGTAARALQHAASKRAQAEAFARMENMPRRMKRSWRKDAKLWAAELEGANAVWERVGVPEKQWVTEAIEELESRIDQLVTTRAGREQWLRQHPEAERRLARLERELMPFGRELGVEPLELDASLPLNHAAEPPQPRGPELDYGIDLAP